MAEKHLCVGPTCWECGEPTELREMRDAIWKAFVNGNEAGLSATQCSKLAKLATATIREDVIAMMTKIVDLQAQVYLLIKPAMTRVEIDPNVRVRGNQTRTSIHDVYGPISVGQPVQVFESEADICGDGWVTDIDTAKGFVYLKVLWSSLKDRKESN